MVPADETRALIPLPPRPADPAAPRPQVPRRGRPARVPRWRGRWRGRGGDAAGALAGARRGARTRPGPGRPLPAAAWSGSPEPAGCRRAGTAARDQRAGAAGPRAAFPFLQKGSTFAVKPNFCEFSAPDRPRSIKGEEARWRQARGEERGAAQGGHGGYCRGAGPLPGPGGGDRGRGRRGGAPRPPRPPALFVRRRSPAPGLAATAARRQGPAASRASRIARGKTGGCHRASLQAREPSPGGEGTGSRSHSTARTRTQACGGPAGASCGRSSAPLAPGHPRFHLPGGGARRSRTGRPIAAVCWITPPAHPGF